MKDVSTPIVRATGILVEDGRILLAKQVLRERSHWTLPGGQQEFDETLEECLVREIREETGLEVRRGDLLYLCDRFHGLGRHVLDVSFLVKRAGGELLSRSASDGGAESISHLEMVPFGELTAYGFSDKFVSLVKAGFPDRGTYQGDFRAFYG